MTRSRLLLLCALSGCVWSAPADDAGDRAFIIDALRVSQGRAPRSMGEVDALVSLMAYNGRGAIVDLLLEDAEMVDHWTRVLADDLGVERTGANRMDPACFGDPLLDDVATVALAGHLRSAAVGARFCVPGPLGPPTEADADAPAELAVDRTALAARGVPPPTDVVVQPARLKREIQASASRTVPSADPTTAWSRRGVTYSAAATAAATSKLPDPGIGGHEIGQSAADAATRDWVDLDRGLTWSVPPHEPDRTTGTDFLPCPEFNLTDSIRAGIVGRSLWVAWRAMLVPASVFIDTSSDLTHQALVSERFYTGWLGRDPSCLGCHTSTYSTTDGRPRNDHWDRFQGVTGPSLVDAEGSAFSYIDGGTEYYGGSGATANVLRHIFRRDVLHGTDDDAGQRPWGLSSACTTRSFGTAPVYGFETGTPTSTLHRAALGRMGPASDLDVLDLIDRFPTIVNGYSTLSSPTWIPSTTAGSATAGLPLFQSRCLTCHDEHADQGMAPAFDTLLPVLPDARLFQVMKYGSMGMARPSPALNDTQITDIIAAIRSTAGFPYVGPARFGDQDDAVAALLAERIVNVVVEDIQGYPLVLSHGFARDAESRNLLTTLTTTLVEGGWSLQELLRFIMLSGAFNRQAPAEGNYEWELPMIADPWAADPPGSSGGPHRDANGQGDLVHRASIPSLLHYVHEALGWPDSRTIGTSTSAWPNLNLQLQLGRPSAFEATSGTPQTDLQTLLKWESTIGTCQKPLNVRAGDVRLAPGVTEDPETLLTDRERWVDWIDVVVDALSTAPDARTVVRALKVRLMADSELAISEEASIASLLGVANLDVAATTLSEAGLRRVCGVLLSTPDLLLRRLPAPPGSRSPTFEVCLETDCTRAEFCAAYDGLLADLGYPYDCYGGVAE